ncbi:hypothetical protein BCR34DRAFT_584259 [Clohesyomyces aquaticus]|uniref:Uncharacterized protein n=1 Tax=Clohesyomyces aquaticus TaxID=1231657 RepID=A0A1Y2A3L3_9PLEO|nr:hypothetical protein BCR34DRAFT_584259 [Clohesyomyces aquaticus]
MLPSSRLLRGVPKPQLSQPLHHKTQRNHSHRSNYSSTPYRVFSTTICRAKDAPRPSSKEQQKPKQTPNDDHVLPNLNLKELIGANRKVYYFVLAVLSVFGTMETIFWCKVIYAKFFAKDEEAGGEEDDK